MHATRSFHSSSHKISSSRPNGDRGGDHHCRKFVGVSGGDTNARENPDAPPPPPPGERAGEPPPPPPGERASPSPRRSRSVGASTASGSDASRNGLLGAPAAAASSLRRTGSVPTEASFRLGHNAARSRSVAASRPASSGRARRTPEPPCVPLAPASANPAALGAGATRPSATGPGSRGPEPGLEPATFVWKSARVSFPSPPPPFSLAAAGPTAEASTPTAANTSAGESNASPSGEKNTTRQGSDLDASHPPSRAPAPRRASLGSDESSSEYESSPSAPTASSSSSASGRLRFRRRLRSRLRASVNPISSAVAALTSARQSFSAEAVPFAAATRVRNTKSCLAASYSL